MMKQQQCVEGFTKQEEKELKQKQDEKYHMFNSNTVDVNAVLIEAEKKGTK